MRKAIQNALAAVIAFLEKEEPKKPCVCITDEDQGHYSDCRVGLARDKRLRWEEAAWVLEWIEQRINESLSTSEIAALVPLRDNIHSRWGIR